MSLTYITNSLRLVILSALFFLPIGAPAQDETELFARAMTRFVSIANAAGWTSDDIGAVSAACISFRDTNKSQGMACLCAFDFAASRDDFARAILHDSELLTSYLRAHESRISRHCESVHNGPSDEIVDPSEIHFL